MTSPDPPRSGDEVGRYRLLDRLGRGAVSAVFRAEEPGRERLVAVKVLDSRVSAWAPIRDQVPAQLRALVDVTHPNVVRVHDVGMHRGSIFIVMEIVDGPELTTWLREEAPSRAEILEAFIGIARGLDAAHAAGVVHGELGPAKILMGGPRAKVRGFGLVPAQGWGAEASGVIFGNPSYMSPEHVRGHGLEPSSDQFSFAVMLYEALYGERPFEGPNVVTIATRMLEGAVPSGLVRPRNRLDRLIRRALRLLRHERFDSMSHVARELQRVRREQ